ncbi:MAG TPA: hypothetical protein VG778_09675 [Blastocatellia bacterium]|jgi:hypothetical protein|nr:hypothetical protein [Blastocatellia bacterium]
MTKQEINSDNVIDLPVADEQAEETTGGSRDVGASGYSDWRTNFGRTS